MAIELDFFEKNVIDIEVKDGGRAGGGGKVNSVNYTQPDAKGNVNVLGWKETVPAKTYTFDGNLEGHEYVYTDDGSQYLVKVSDDVPPFEALPKPWVYEDSKNGTLRIDPPYYRDIPAYGGEEVMIIYTECADASFNPTVTVSPGVWFHANGIPGEPLERWVESVTVPAYDIYHEISPEYLPDGIGYKKRATEPISFTFNGDLDSTEHIEAYRDEEDTSTEIQYYVKISDEVLPAEAYAGGYAVITGVEHFIQEDGSWMDNTEHIWYSIPPYALEETLEKELGVEFVPVGNLPCFLVSKDISLMGISLTRGTYGVMIVREYSDGTYMKAWVSELTTTAKPVVEMVTVPQEYLPETARNRTYSVLVMNGYDPETGEDMLVPMQSYEGVYDRMEEGGYYGIQMVLDLGVVLPLYGYDYRIREGEPAYKHCLVFKLEERYDSSIDYGFDVPENTEYINTWIYFWDDDVITIEYQFVPRLTITTTEKFRIEYDGNPDNKEVVALGTASMCIKLADEVYSEEVWIGGTITTTASGSGNVATHTVVEDDIVQDALGSGTGYMVANTFAVITGSDPDLSAGVWLVFPASLWEQTKNHTMVFEGVSGTTVTKIDPKFIPIDAITQSVIDAIPTAEGGSF